VLDGTGRTRTGAGARAFCGGDAALGTELGGGRGEGTEEPAAANGPDPLGFSKAGGEIVGAGTTCGSAADGTGNGWRAVAARAVAARLSEAIDELRRPETIAAPKATRSAMPITPPTSAVIGTRAAEVGTGTDRTWGDTLLSTRGSSGQLSEEGPPGNVSAKGSTGDPELEGATEKPRVPRRETTGASAERVRVIPERSTDSGLVAVATEASEWAPDGGGAACVVLGKTDGCGAGGVEEYGRRPWLERGAALPASAECGPMIAASVTRFSVSSCAAIA
jgi:hypothetical protein